MKPFLALFVSLFLFCSAVALADECTTAVVAGSATRDGAPLLWKNRDADMLSNKVILVEDVPFRYLAVVNADDTSGRTAWAGLNAVGFAIINSVAYNLPQRGGEAADLEGLVMATALRTCRTVADFESFLKRNLNSGFGTRANYCVIDAEGGSAIFETHNHGYTRLNADTTREHYLLNTNFSRSGPEGQGLGYVRFDRETQLFQTVSVGQLSHQFILQTVARDLGNPYEHHPAPEEWKKMSEKAPVWVYTSHTINRPSTACGVVIHGVRKGEDPSKATLWVILGEPVTSIAVPLWVKAGSVPDELHAGTDAPIYTESVRLRNIARHMNGRERKDYLAVMKLDNKEGTGWLPGNLATERQILDEAAALLKGNPTASDLARFQQSAATRVLKKLSSDGNGKAMSRK